MGREGEAVSHTGGCQCGAIRYAVRGAVTTCSICHCRMCQKAGAAPFLVFVAVSTGAVTWTRGAPASFASSSVARRGFCRDCGTPLSFQSRPGQIELTHGSLDDPAAITPTRRLASETVLPWSERVEALPIQALADWIAQKKSDGLRNDQHPDHD